jgi:hypothetical protein
MRQHRIPPPVVDLRRRLTFQFTYGRLKTLTKRPWRLNSLRLSTDDDFTQRQPLCLRQRGGWLMAYLSEGASVGGICNSSLPTAFCAWRRIDFVIRPHWLLYGGIASAIACRTFRFGRLRGSRSPSR